MVEFRDLKEADMAMLLTWRNLPEVREFMYSDQVISAEEHQRWFHSAMADKSRRYWIIVVDGEDVGLVNLIAIDRANKRCSWAFYLASPNVRGKGVGSVVEWNILNIVFEQMGLNRLCCEVLVTNPAVISMHKKFGFREEGHFRQHVLRSGEAVDVTALALLISEWKQQRPEIEARLRSKGLID